MGRSNTHSSEMLRQINCWIHVCLLSQGPRLRSLVLEITRESTNRSWTTQQWQQSIRVCFFSLCVFEHRGDGNSLKRIIRKLITSHILKHTMWFNPCFNEDFRTMQLSKCSLYFTDEFINISKNVTVRSKWTIKELMFIFPKQALLPF